MKKLSIFLLALVAGVGTIYASNTKVNGIWYDFDSSSETATVTYRGSTYNSYYNEYSGEVVIPSSVTYNAQTYSVTRIGDDAFWECTGLTSVTIPNSVTSIGNEVFSYCTGLTSVTIPNSVTSIGIYAFSDCYRLTSVTIPNSVTSIRGYTFFNCSGLTSVTIPNSVTSIERSAFTGCRGLTSIEIPNSVTSIGDWVFTHCTGLTSIVVQEGNLKYDSRESCNAVIESSTNRLVLGCKNSIIPNSVTSIGSTAFSGCTGLTSVTIPNSVTSIGSSAFYYCSSLTSVTIPESVTSIGDYAFSGCSSLTSVTIGNSVTSIGDYAFYGCTGLTAVTNYATTPQSIDSNVFGGNASYPGVNNSTCVLNVPKESVSLYQAAYVWKEFTHIVGVDAPQGVEKVLSDKVSCTKLIRNGNVYILTDDKTYTITGQQVK